MKEKMRAILLLLKKEHGVDFADIRINDIYEEHLGTEDGQVEDLSVTRRRGYGVRVYLDGSMGFAGSQDFAEMEKTALLALSVAKASRLAQKEAIRLAAKEAVVGQYQTPIEIDPLTVPKQEKLDLLFAAEKKMRQAAPALFKTKGSLDFRKEEKIYADSEGSYITQTLYESGGGIEAIAANEQDLQKRSWPTSFGGNFASAGFEFILKLGLLENAERIAKEAQALLEAEECPSGVFDLIIDSSQLALQIHESVGHPIELDRVFGYEAGYAGTSFLSPEMLGFAYGSQHVSIVADATVEGGLGTFGYDDDGILAQKVPIVEKGKFTGFISSRDTASRLGQPSSGAARADGWNRIPLVRMTNINLLPGSFQLAELIRGIDYGFYLETNKSWSIDDKRLNFQFACEIAREIKEGKLTGRIFKNPIYTGITPEFWNSCDGVATEEHWQLFGIPNCGKGEPGQVAHVGHGSAPARFRKVKVGVLDVQ